MKYLKKLLSVLCYATVFIMPWYPVSAGYDELVELRKASDNVLYHEVEDNLSSKILVLEKSLKENISGVKEVFNGLTIRDELGIKVKVYRNQDKDDYYYFLMATADNYTDNSSKDNFIIVKDLYFSFDKNDFFSKLAGYSESSGAVNDGKAKGATFILDGSLDEFYVGLKFYNNVEKKKGHLYYKLSILPDGKHFMFKGFANGDVCFQQKMFAGL
jgi:hypothetical protein